MTVSAQFGQAIVLCGAGSKLGALSSDETRLPKALLPVDNVPVVQRTLDWLLADGTINEIFLVTRTESEKAIKDFTASYKPPKTNGNASIKVLLTPTEYGAGKEGQKGKGLNLDDDESSASLLAVSAALPQITCQNFVVAACDIVTDLPFAEVTRGVLEASAVNGGEAPSVTMLCYEGSKVELTGASVERGNDKDVESDYLGFSHPTSTHPSQLVLYRPFNPDRESISIPSDLLSLHSQVKMTTAYRDAHLYVFAKWVGDWLLERLGKTEWTMLREQAVPVLVKAAWKGDKWREKHRLGNSGNTPAQIQINPLLVPSTSKHFILRANRPWSLLESNRRLLDAQPPAPPSKEKQTTLIRRSAVGPDCKLGADVKIVNSVVGRGVEIGDKSKVEGCIVLDGAKVGKNCNLTGCDVGPGAVVEDGTTAKGETFAVEQEDEDDE